jgi:hypothetical protein
MPILRGLIACGVLALVVGAQQWQRLPATAHPPMDGRVTMVFDPIRDRTVCIADEVIAATPWFTSRRVSTWEWDGANWRQRVTATEPGSGSRPSTATFDAGRGQVVLLDGLDGCWAFDGDDWQPLQLGPTPTGSASLTFDSARGVLVLCAGSQLLEEQNGQWTPRASFAPMSQNDTVVAFDPSSGTTLAFGGWNLNGNSNTTWRWDGVNLVPLTPPTLPPGRSEHVLAFDPAAGRLLLIGGIAYQSPLGALADVYAWSGTDWLVQPSLPLPRRAAAAAPFRGDLCVFGGVLSGPAGELRSHELLQRTAVGTWANVPQPTAGWLAAHDSARGRTVAVVDNRTLEFDGYVWTDTTIPYPGTPFVGLAFHSPTARIVGFTSTGATWTYDGLAWAAVPTPLGPPPRESVGMAEDPARGVVVLAGGSSPSSQPLDDVWEWNGVGWAARLPMPTAGWCSMTWDGQRIVAVVPTIGWGPAQTFAWNGTSWSTVGPAPSGFLRHRSAWHPGLGAVLVAAEYPVYSSADAAWRLVGSTWQPLGVSLDARSGGGSLVFDTNRGRLICHDPVHRRDHVLTVTPATRAAYGVGCGGAAGAPRLTAIADAQIGTPVVHDVLQAAPNSFAVLFADFLAASIPLPTGCTALLANPLAVGAAPTNGAGFASFALPIPRGTALIGSDIFSQALVLDAGGPLVGFASLTAGTRLTIGD